MPAPAAYATRDELNVHVEGGHGLSNDAADRLIAEASLDVDRMVGAWSVEANGLKFGAPAGANEKDLAASQVAALKRAALAQAEMLLGQRPAAGTAPVDPRATKVEGPDFAITYGQGGAGASTTRYSDDAARELIGAGLVRAAASW